MDALIICSLHALCDISQFEWQACNRACALHGIPAILTPRDHELILSSATMLDVLNHLPGSAHHRQALIDSYLDLLNDEIWNASISTYRSVFRTLLGPQGYVRPTGFVSDYPLLTTNLIRSAALLTNATKLGHLTALTDPLNVTSTAAGLAASAASLEVAHNDVDVLVAHQRDFAAAQSIGMHPRYVAELRPDTSEPMPAHQRCAYIPATSTINSAVISHAVSSFA